MEHQARVHSFVTDVIGPSEPVRLLGTTVTDVVPMACTPGDIPAAFVALSYAGTITVSVVVDPSVAADLAGLRDRFAAELSVLVTRPVRQTSCRSPSDGRLLSSAFRGVAPPEPGRDRGGPKAPTGSYRRVCG